jgi:uncharacterized membrane protein YphA (DoxX/SURF4 family)
VPDAANNKQRALMVAARIALAAIFLVYGYAKIKPLPGLPWSVHSVELSLSNFTIEVDRYDLLPPSTAIAFAKILPPFEILLGIWLLSGFELRFSSLCASLLMAAFLFAVVWAYAHGRIFDCGCGFHEVIGPRKIGENSVMLAVAIGLTVEAFRLRSSPASKPV